MCAICCAKAVSLAVFPAFASRCPRQWFSRPMCSINSSRRTIFCDFALHCEDDAEIQRKFLAAPLPDALIEDLKAFLAEVHYPLAVRSSSLLEDSQYQPFTGVYETFMLGNQQPNLEAPSRRPSARPSGASTLPLSAAMRRPMCEPRRTAWKKKKWRSFCSRSWARSIASASIQIFLA